MASFFGTHRTCIVVVCYFQHQTEHVVAGSCDISISVIGSKSQDTSQPVSTLTTDISSSVLPGKDESVLWAADVTDLLHRFSSVLQPVAGFEIKYRKIWSKKSAKNAETRRRQCSLLLRFHSKLCAVSIHGSNLCIATENFSVTWDKNYKTMISVSEKNCIKFRWNVSLVFITGCTTNGAFGFVGDLQR